MRFLRYYISIDQRREKMFKWLKNVINSDKFWEYVVFCALMIAISNASGASVIQSATIPTAGR